MSLLFLSYLLIGKTWYIQEDVTGTLVYEIVRPVISHIRPSGADGILTVCDLEGI